MKFINRTNNTVYAQDIDRHFMYVEDNVQEISSNDLLRSQSLQQIIALGGFEIVEIGNSRIEKNLLRIQKQMATLKKFTALGKTDEPTVSSIGRQVLIKGHFLEGGGYAKYNRNLALGLKKAGIDVKIDVLGNRNNLNEEEVRELAPLRGGPSKDAIRIDSVIPSFSNISGGKYSILYTTVESYTLPKQFVELAQNYREIWVTSDFCKEILQKHKVTRPIYVMPCSIDTDKYTEEGESYQFRPSLKPFVFTSVFGWSYRKGYDVLLRSYLQEFSGKDPVSLLIVSKFQNDSGRSDVVRDGIQKFIEENGGEDPPHVVRCSKDIPESMMPSMYRASNAFVLFSRGEGFGLPYCEASLCGVPVIGTACSAQTMFLSEDNSSLLPVDKLTKLAPGTMHIHYWDDQEFPAFTSQESISKARSLLREVYSKPEKAINKNRKLQAFIRSNYSIEESVGKIIKRLEEIWRA